MSILTSMRCFNRLLNPIQKTNYNLPSASTLTPFCPLRTSSSSSSQPPLPPTTCITRKGSTLALENPAPILSFNQLREDVYKELVHHDVLQGTPWMRFPELTHVLKGHRRGELTVMTGSTGSGKTTFLAESSLDLCLQGVKTLWGSFEVKNVRLAKMLLSQLAQTRLEMELENFDHWADHMARLPMYFMDFHGTQSLTSVLETMSIAVANLDVHHVILDNLQFMIGNDYNVSGRRRNPMNRFEIQDMIVGSMRRFATEHDCHVTLVIHPRKEAEEELTNNSIFGGAKAIQEADNILILQVKTGNGLRMKKYVQVTKNRYSGDLGLVPLVYDRDRSSFQRLGTTIGTGDLHCN